MSKRLQFYKNHKSITRFKMLWFLLNTFWVAVPGFYKQKNSPNFENNSNWPFERLRIEHNCIFQKCLLSQNWKNWHKAFVNSVCERFLINFIWRYRLHVRELCNYKEDHGSYCLNAFFKGVFLCLLWTLLF